MRDFPPNELFFYKICSYLQLFWKRFLFQNFYVKIFHILKVLRFIIYEINTEILVYYLHCYSVTNNLNNSYDTSDLV